MGPVYVFYQHYIVCWTACEEVVDYFLEHRPGEFEISVVKGHVAEQLMDQYSDLEIIHEIDGHYFTPSEYEMFELSLGQIPLDLKSMLSKYRRLIQFLKEGHEFHLIQSLFDYLDCWTERLLDVDLVDPEQPLADFNTDKLIEAFLRRE